MLAGGVQEVHHGDQEAGQDAEVGLDEEEIVLSLTPETELFTLMWVLPKVRLVRLIKTKRLTSSQVCLCPELLTSWWR